MDNDSISSTKKECLVDICHKSAENRDRGRRGYCSHHYRRLMAYGDPLGTPPPKIIPTEQKCSRCKIVKPLTDFYKLPTRWNGVTYRCKKCCTEIQRDARAADPEKSRAVARADYAKHPERFQGYAVKYDRNAMIRDWKGRNPELVAAYAQDRRARELGGSL